ncbi:MAG: alkaline phosphatase family protein [Solirubrobacterales bacterium]
MTTKLILIVVDALKPAMLEHAIVENRAPAFAEILRRGTYLPDCVSTFPSVTPVASATITTGEQLSEHNVPAINWYHRGESRYVEYGSSLASTRTFGLCRTLTDIVYNMNFEHLSRRVSTFFELLDDRGVRTACTPYLIYRGHTRHELALEGWWRRAAQAANFRHAVYGPSELFYGELFTSRPVDCQPTLARPGTRDPYSACVGEYLERRDLYDFMLFSLPDNDHHSHSHGPGATVDSIARADRYLMKLATAAGGLDRFLSDRAVILMADHAQTPVTERIPLVAALADDWRVLGPDDPEPRSAELAVSPGARAAMVYLLGERGDRQTRLRRVTRRLRSLEGVELLAWIEGDEGCVRSDHGELRFRPGSGCSDLRGGGWDVDGHLEALQLERDGELISSRVYPDALARLWSALRAPSSGDLLLSAALGYEFTDWGGVTHVPGGSHGSLRRGDSLGPLAFVNCGPDLERDGAQERPQWSIGDVAPAVLGHFPLPADNGR